MATAPAVELRTFTELDPARGDLLDVYDEVRAPLLHLPDCTGNGPAHRRLTSTPLSRRWP
ncbi:hypothetical protein SAZ_03880 [Streptomyces noursei ZPM]|uniref:Uncharacterized protein n=1 Tax=Streptomyces noursei TaxID=1971 RepID=A0A401QTV9_STRNR|nr:hypothetical protein SAZ_03880 [Streptomyces noursei ZPM]GCB88810.1 hypothetical protein SALB_01483 [Streptomyces noursei]